MLADYKRDFIAFALETDVLRFGEFELKSGRISPWFFNAGLFRHGASLGKLGGYYADALMASGLPTDCLFGPAYKGIPLVTATAIALASGHDKDIPWTFNRKEAKDHGEGGILVGAEPTGNVTIVDDVISAGTSIREVMGIIEGLKAAGKKVKVSGVLVAIDRQERGKGELSAIQEVERDFGVQVASIVTLADIIEYLEESGGPKTEWEAELKAIRQYQEQYGI